MAVSILCIFIVVAWVSQMCMIVIGNAITWSYSLYKNSKWVWSENTTITNCRQTCGFVRKSHTTITRHQEDKQSKAASSRFPIEMIAKLEWTQNDAQQTIFFCNNLRPHIHYVGPELYWQQLMVNSSQWQRSYLCMKWLHKYVDGF